MFTLIWLALAAVAFTTAIVQFREDARWRDEGVEIGRVEASYPFVASVLGIAYLVLAFTYFLDVLP